MWSIVNSMGNPAHTMGPFTNQKREFSLNVEKVPIVPGKTFRNPNFVIKHHPSVHNNRNNFIPITIPIEKLSHNHSTNSALINSSQSLVDTLKEHHLDTVKTPEPPPVVLQEKTKPVTMCTKKRHTRKRRNRRKAASGKKSNKNNTKSEIRDMMEAEVDVDTPLNVSETSESPKIHNNTFNLTDFIVGSPCKLSCTPVDDRNDDSDDEEFVTTIISVSPLSISQTIIRDRRLSITESEDSFIMFSYGTDEELGSSDETDTETEDEEEDEEVEEEEEDCGEDEVDFILPVIPRKKVRFAQDSDLCEVHKMVKWSYAYQQARKGHWEEYARDRDRFKRRAADIEAVLMPVLSAAHRDKIYRERFNDKTF